MRLGSKRQQPNVFDQQLMASARDSSRSLAPGVMIGSASAAHSRTSSLMESNELQLNQSREKFGLSNQLASASIVNIN